MLICSALAALMALPEIAMGGKDTLRNTRLSLARPGVVNVQYVVAPPSNGAILKLNRRIYHFNNAVYFSSYPRPFHDGWNEFDTKIWQGLQQKELTPQLLGPKWWESIRSAAQEIIESNEMDEADRRICSFLNHFGGGPHPLADGWDAYNRMLWHVLDGDKRNSFVHGVWDNWDD